MEHKNEIEIMKKYLDHNYECILDIIERNAKKGINPHEAELMYYLSENREFVKDLMKEKGMHHEDMPKMESPDHTVASKNPY